MPSKEKSKPAELSFEEALAQLEEAVAVLESGEVSLDEAMKAFAKGTELARLCQAKLDEAEKQLAPGLLLDGQGKPTTDPAVMFEDPVGALLPFGEHKGYALAFMCELLGGALSGGMVQDHAPIDNPLINNMFSIIFDPYKLTSKEKFDKQVANLMDWLKASPPMKEDQPVKFPGDPEQTTRTKRSEEGIPLAPGSLQALLDCAENVGIENPGEMLQ